MPQPGRRAESLLRDAEDKREEAEVFEASCCWG
jgi:hypothetical protein